MKKTLLCLLLCICFFCLPACQTPGTPPEVPAVTPPEVPAVTPHVLSATLLLAEVYAGATAGEPLPSVEEYDNEVHDGDPTPVKYLKKADGSHVGKTYTLRLENPGRRADVLVFAPATEGVEEHVTILMIGNTEERVLIRLKTAYGSTQSFCESFDGTVTGTITDLHIIDTFDYIYPLHTLFLAEDNRTKGISPTTAADNGFRYVYYIRNKQTLIFTESEVKVEAFQRVYDRFGLTP